MNGYLELEWKYEVITNVHKGSFSGDGNDLNLIAVMVTQFGKFTKNSLNCICQM